MVHLEDSGIDDPVEGVGYAQLMDSQPFEQLVASFAAGEPVATAEVFDRFRARLVALARQRIKDPRLLAKFDPEDIVQSVFLTFWRRCRDGEFALEDWDAFWSLLAKITERRCHKYWKLYRQTSKRDTDRETANAAEVGSSATDPVRAAIVSDLLERLLGQLDENSQLTLVLKLQGCTETEICETLKCSVRSVRRRAARIREVMEATQ